MRARVARQALEGSRQIDELADVGIVLVQALELLFLLERLVERDADLEGDQLRNLVDIAIVVPSTRPTSRTTALAAEVP